MADAPEYLMGMFALLSAALLVDVALFASIERHGQALEQDQRAAVLAERLDACLAEYAGAVVQVERAAALRHDLRNHLQVAGALVERGELARAEGYVGEAIDGASCRTRYESTVVHTFDGRHGTDRQLCDGCRER